MRLLHSCILSALFGATVFGASTTASVASIGGESTGSCSDTRMDGRTASCHAASPSGAGDSLSHVEQFKDYDYVWLGWLHSMQAFSSPTVQSRARVTFSSEFSSLRFQGHGGIRITYDMPTSERPRQPTWNPVEVRVNDGFGNYPLAGTLYGAGDSLDVPYGGYPINIVLEAATPIGNEFDYIALFRVKVSLY